MEKNKKEIFSLHTHTVGFDGSNSVQEMVQAAQQIGYSAIGITNHFIVYPGIENTAIYKVAKFPPKEGRIPYHQMYSLSFEDALEKFKRNYDEIEKVKAQTSFPIYKGMEADFFQYAGWGENFAKALDTLKPDYVIGSTHFSVYKGQLMNMHDVQLLPEKQRNEVIHDYWKNARKAIKSGFFNFMAHLDLYKLRGLGLEDEFREDEKETVACLAECGVAAEINTGLLGKKNKYGKDYDTDTLLQLLQLFAQFKIPTFLSDDAHKIGSLAAGYDVASKTADQAGVVQYCRPICKNGKFQLEKYLVQQNERQ
ncbi:MAG: PHP domain-containing protein [Alphaproteobacteria bacterium]|nr:PHP domain-containing protein [Alphaproteobacteria bacterium]